MHTSNKQITPFLERISQLNFDKYYTTTNRILCHTFMWLFFSLLLFLNYWLELEMTIQSCILLTARGTINNMMAFYLFFYIIVPQIFKSKTWGICLVIFSIPFLIYLWLSVNYFQFNLFHYLGIEIHGGPFDKIVSKNVEQPYSKAVSFKSIFGNAMLVIYSFSPPFFIKILFDIIKLFNRTIYFQKQASDLELQNLNIEKNFLKAQLNPHFLFNTLNNLYGLVVKQDPNAAEAIINISDLMAYTLYESNTEKVPIQKELDFIQNYFYLERMRYAADKDITLDISMPPNIDNMMIAPLLTFTFIENGFKYGLKDVDNNFLKINIKIVDNIFYFSIVNNKEKNSIRKNMLGGIGVKNIEKRLSLIYPQKHELVIEDKETRFFVSLSIDLTYDE